MTIFELEFLGFQEGMLRLRVRCSKGTYIRTLCKDIGQALGCGGCMAALRRTSAGSYGIEDAVPLQTLMDTQEPEKYLQTVDTMFSRYEAVTLSPNQETRCRNGNAFSRNAADGTYRVYGRNGDFLCLSHADHGTLTSIKNFFGA